jgi:hypothetical protein
VGYDLQSSIILSDQTGQPIAPVAQRLVTANGSYATYQEETIAETIENHLDEVTHCISKLEQQNFAKPLVHIIDREADSVGHIRQWKANNCLWLTRSKKTPAIEQCLAHKSLKPYILRKYGSLIIMVNANGNGLQRHGFD